MDFFDNEPIRSLKDIRWVDSVCKYVREIEDRLVHTGPIVIDNPNGSNRLVYSRDPSNWELIVSQCHDTDYQRLESEIQKLKPFKLTEGSVHDIEEKLVKLLQKNRDRLVALLMVEVGKPIIEADADVAEAIDFVRYYSKLRAELKEKILYKNQSEECRLFYEPRGIAAVISPWNFPVAIPIGMIISNLFVGNPVIFKPAEQSLLIGYEVFKILREAGFDETQIQFAPGYGETIGEALVKSRLVDIIMFTGSRAVGEMIMKISSGITTSRGFKRVVAEMGGKNAIYVDSGVDVQKAVDIVITSAFGYAGQKCSACSRVFVNKQIFDEFLSLLAAKVESLRVGSAKDPEVFLPFVIDESAYRRLSRAVKEAESLGLVKARSVYPEVKNAGLIPACVLLNPPKSSSYAREELFGPILSVFPCDSFEDALVEINDVDYALTGGVITGSQAVIEAAVDKFNCGNLYINRKITGALVGRHPFGGRKFSGIGFKAGGENYLKQLTLEKAVSICD